MKRNINIIKAIPSFEIKSKGDNKERKYHSEIEKKKKVKKDNSKEQIKYFIPL